MEKVVAIKPSVDKDHSIVGELLTRQRVMEDWQNLIESVVKGDLQKVEELVKVAINDGNILADDILTKGLIAGMSIVGEKMQTGEVFIPEVLFAARAMNAGLEILRPLLSDREAKALGRMVIGTVQGDLHDIGKNLVRILMEGAGFDVVDLGIDVNSLRFVEAVRANSPNILGISALLTTTMPRMKEIIKALEEAELRRQVKVLVGGAPVTEKFARDIGADGYAPNAGSAVKITKKLLGL